MDSVVFGNKVNAGLVSLASYVWLWGNYIDVLITQYTYFNEVRNYLTSFRFSACSKHRVSYKFSFPCVNAESQALTTQQSTNYAYYKHFVCIAWVVINISWVFEDSLITYFSIHSAKYYLDLYIWIWKRLRKTQKKENSFQVVPLMYMNNRVKIFAFLNLRVVISLSFDFLENL